MSRVRQTDIAERLGISQQAVAFALSDQPAYRKKLNVVVDDALLRKL